MTLRFVDSFDGYVTADVLQKWTSAVNISGVSISAGNGRYATQSLRIAAPNSECILKKYFGAQASWVVGGALKFTLYAGQLGPQIRLFDGATEQCSLRVQTDGTLIISRNGTTIAGPFGALSQGTQYHVAFKVTISDSAGAGTVVVKVNGIEIYSNSGSLDTKETANATADTVGLGVTFANACTYDFDDIYIEDGVDATATQGAPFNDFLGDCRVKALYAAADGNYTGNWTRNGAGVDADYKAVDEALQDGDTTYLSDNTVDHRSSWTFGSMGSVGTVKAVAMNCVARKDDAGTKLLDVFARRTATDYDRNKDFSLLDGYSNHQEIWGTHPDTTAWTPTIVNALEAGIRMDT